VYTRCSKLGNKSLDLSWVIVSEKQGTEETLAQGVAVIVCFDYAANKTIVIPEEQRKKIEAFEKIN
jgi:acyl-CoA thioester hydrolase